MIHNHQNQPTGVSLNCISKNAHIPKVHLSNVQDVIVRYCQLYFFQFWAQFSVGPKLFRLKAIVQFKWEQKYNNFTKRSIYIYTSQNWSRILFKRLLLLVHNWVPEFETTQLAQEFGENFIKHIIRPSIWISIFWQQMCGIFSKSSIRW